MKQLWSVDAPHFCAGLSVEAGAVVEAAPIVRWTVGKSWAEVHDYMERKGWKMTLIDDRTKLLDILAEDASVCDACSLCKTRTQAVFSRGSAYASLMFVGEAPGWHEDVQGKPFVGPSGELLDRMIDAMGLKSSDVYICNAIKCRPPDNRTPDLAEVHACKAFLMMQVRLVKPKVIVALGRSASYALSEDVPLELLFPRDWVGKWREFLGVPVITTYHPAYLLRTPSAKKIVGKHLHEILKRLKS